MLKINFPKILTGLFIVFVLAASAAAFRAAVRQPFHLDETEEATMGFKMSRIGPRTFLPVPGGGMEVTHPLLYTFTHAAVQRIFGSGEFPLRMYGVAHFIICLLLMMAIIKETIKEENRYLKNIGMGIGALLYVINPLLIQHSVVINADNNILTTTILIFIYFFIRFEKLEGDDYFSSRFILGALLAVCFWAKELAPAFIFIGIILYRLINREYTKLICEFVLIGMLGLAIFWVTWWIYCAATGTDVLGFIKFTLIGKSRKAFSYEYMSGIFDVAFYGSRWNIYWVSAPFFISLAVFTVIRARDYLSSRRLGIVDLIFICAAAVWLPFQLFRPTVDMVKYQYPTYPLFIIAIAYIFVKIFKARAQKLNTGYLTGPQTMLALALIGILTLHYYMIGDYLLALWKPVFRHINGHFLIYYYFPIAVLIAAVAVFTSRRSVVWNNMLLSIMLFIVPVNLGLDLNHAKADYATFEIWLNYGEAGLRQTAEYLKGKVRDGALISVRSDLEYYLTCKYKLKVRNVITPEKIFRAADDREIDRLFYEVPIQYIVVDHVSMSARASPNTPQLINKYFIFDSQIGDFYIYRNKRG